MHYGTFTRHRHNGEVEDFSAPQFLSPSVPDINLISNDIPNKYSNLPMQDCRAIRF